jgi:hypothetical protein
MPAQRHPAFRLPRDAVTPDYGVGGLFGLVGAVRRFLDGEPWRLPGEGPVAAAADAAAPVVVFILVDGLGDGFLQRFGAGGALLAHRVGRLTSVFPSTTASAVATVLTGLAPASHGLTGWFLHDRRFGGVIAPLPMMKRSGGEVRGLLRLPRLFPYRTLFQGRRRPSVLVSPRSLAYSPFSRRHGRGARVVAYHALGGMIEAIAAAVVALREGGGGYVHAYYPRFDALSHAHGCAAGEVVDEFARIDGAFRTLLAQLAGSGAEVVVSADHGFIDSPEERLIHLDRHPEAIAMLAAPLSGERRAAYCHVRRGAGEAFAAFAREVLAGKAVLVRSDELLASGLLGPGRAHRRLRERVGTHTLLMEAGWTVRDRVPGEHNHPMLGVHGGLSPAEMWVPLVQARC